jgi:hypothetical protein
VPELDYAVLCDYVRAEGGVAHVVAAGIDTVWAAEVPTGRNVGLLARLTFTRHECGRPHRLEVIFQDIDGDRLAVVQGVVNPQWIEGLPTGWRTGTLLGLNMGIPLPRYGVYGFEIMLNDSFVKNIDFRVVQQAAAPGE